MRSLPAPWIGGEDQRIIGLGPGVERPVESLHDEFRADQRQVLGRVRLCVGAGVGWEPAVEAGDAVPFRQGVDPVLQLVEDMRLGRRVDRGPACRDAAGAEVVGVGEVVAEFGDVGVAQRPIADRRQARRLPPFRQAPRRLVDNLDPVAEVVPGEAPLRRGSNASASPCLGASPR